MLNTKFIDELSGRISQLAAATPAADLEKNAKALLASVFSRMDLVSREDFDIQRELLAKALEVPGSAVDVIHGATARLKTLRIAGDPARLSERIEKLLA